MPADLSTPAIQTRNLSKVYRARTGSVTAVQDLNLSIARGQIFGLLGPNGAGKTTTIRMLCGLLRPTGGEAMIEGLSITADPLAVRTRIGLVPEDAGDHKNLTMLEELEYYGAFYGLDRATVERRATPLLERLGLGEPPHHYLKTFSRGMRRKFHLIRALLHQPRILLLDEPTAGLDPAVVEEVWDLFKALTAEHQVTVILCSHHLEEVQRLCQRVAILKQRLLVEGPLSELAGGGRRYRVELASDPAAAAAALAGVPGLDAATVEGQVLRLTLTGDPQALAPQVVRRLVESGAAILEITRDNTDLRSLYRSVVENGRDPASSSTEPPK